MITSLLFDGCAMILIAGAAGGGSVPDELVCPGILARGQVISVEKPPAESRLKIRVVEVFAGDKGIAGRTIEINTNFTGQKTQGWPALDAVPAPGTDGIFILRRAGNELSFDPSNAAIGLIELPSVRGDPGDEYEAVLEWAEKVQEVLAMGPALRYESLRTLVMDSSPEISAWATDVVGRVSAKDSPQTLDAMVAESQLPLAAQVVLDRYLSEVRRKIWLDSPVRNKMVESWVGNASPVSAKLQRFVAARLSEAAASGQLSGSFAMRLVQRAIANNSIAESQKQAYFHLLTRLRRELGTSRETFEFLTEQIDSARSGELALAAAVALRDTCEIDGPRRAALEKLRRQIENPKVAEVLDQTLRGE